MATIVTTAVGNCVKAVAERILAPITDHFTLAQTNQYLFFNDQLHEWEWRYAKVHFKSFGCGPRNIEPQVRLNYIDQLQIAHVVEHVYSKKCTQDVAHGIHVHKMDSGLCEYYKYLYFVYIFLYYIL